MHVRSRSEVASLPEAWALLGLAGPTAEQGPGLRTLPEALELGGLPLLLRRLG